MFFLFESIIVGVLCIILYEILTFFIPVKNIHIFLFIHGFLKHLLGYLLGIHTYYCNNGSACNKSSADAGKLVASTTNTQLFFECIGEGILFLMLGSLFYMSSYLLKHKIITIFFIGFSLHVIFELLGFHALFCKYRCKRTCTN